MLGGGFHTVQMPTSTGSVVEVRRFDDRRLQEAVGKAIQKAEAAGAKHAIFFNANVEGEIKAGAVIRLDKHWSFGGFLEKRPNQKLEGMVEVTFVS